MIFRKDEICKWAVKTWVSNQQTSGVSKSKLWLIGNLLPQKKSILAGYVNHALGTLTQLTHHPVKDAEWY